MLTELPRDDRERIRPLFGGFGHRLHGCIEALCTPDFGRMWVDNDVRPGIAVGHLDFWFVAGDAGARAAADAVSMMPSRCTIVTPGGDWDIVLRRILGGRLYERTRTGFASPENWDGETLRAIAREVPAGFDVHRVTAPEVEEFTAIESALTGNFPSKEAFVERGVGFGAWRGGRCVAGCSSFTLANGRLEVEIDTHPAYQRRGLARALAATLILYCIEHGIEPCWDAHNPMSAALALQLGFVEPEEYTVFVMGANPTAPEQVASVSVPEDSHDTHDSPPHS